MTTIPSARSRKNPPAMTGSPSVRQAALFVAVITCVAFINSFAGRFVFDDIHEIQQNPSMERLLPPWNAMFVGNKVPARPLPYLTFAIDHAVWGVRPFGYHITNLLVHVIAALALFHLVRLTLLSPRLRHRWGDRAVPLAMVIAMLWAVHPLQTQAVTYVYQRIESMTGMFCLVSLATFARATASGWPPSLLAGSIAAAAAAMASKENAVVLPLLILSYDWFFVDSCAEVSGDEHPWFRHLWKRRWYFGLLASTWLILALQLVFLGKNYQEFQEQKHPPLHYALTQPGVILHYLRLACWPVGQLFDYSSWPVATSLSQVLPSVAAVAALVIATIVATLRRRPWAWLGVLFFLALAPTSSILPIEAVANEHRMYLALAAVVAAVVFAVVSLSAWIAGHGPGWLPRGPRLGVVMAGATIMLLVVTTQFRNQVYQNVSSLWLDVIAKDPGNYRAFWNLSAIFDQLGEQDTASLFAEKTLHLKPTANLFSELAGRHLATGDLAGAERFCRRGAELQAAALGPTHKATLATVGDLAIALRLQGKNDEAAQLCVKWLDDMRRVLGTGDSITISAEVIVAESLSRNGRHAEAEAACRAALADAERAFGPLHPITVNAVVVLASVQVAAGKLSEAEQLLRTTLSQTSRVAKHDVAHATPLYDPLVEILQTTGRHDEAVTIRRRLAADTELRKGPNDRESKLAATKLAMAVASQSMARGDRAEAARLYRLLAEGYAREYGADHPDAVAAKARLDEAERAPASGGGGSRDPIPPAGR